MNKKTTVILWIVAVFMITCTVEACRQCDMSMTRAGMEARQIKTFKDGHEAVVSKMACVTLFQELMKDRKDLDVTEYNACVAELRNIRATVDKILKLFPPSESTELANKLRMKKLYLSLHRLEERMFNHAMPQIEIH